MAASRTGHRPSVTSRGLWAAAKSRVGCGPAPQLDRPCLPPSTLGQERHGCSSAARRGARREGGGRPWTGAGLSLEQWLPGACAPATALCSGQAFGVQGWGRGQAFLGWACRVRRGVGLQVQATGTSSSSAGPGPGVRGALAARAAGQARAAGWRSPHFLLARRLQAPREQRVDCASSWACSPPGRCPCRAPWATLVSGAKQGSSGQAARAQRAGGHGHRPRPGSLGACPEPSWPATRPAGLPESSGSSQAVSAVPAPHLLLCRHFLSPAHGSPAPAPAQPRPPVSCDAHHHPSAPLDQRQTPPAVRPARPPHHWASGDAQRSELASGGPRGPGPSVSKWAERKQRNCARRPASSTPPANI